MCFMHPEIIFLHSLKDAWREHLKYTKNIFMLAKQYVCSILIQFFTTLLAILLYSNIGDSTTGPVIASLFPIVTKQHIYVQTMTETLVGGG